MAAPFSQALGVMGAISFFPLRLLQRRPPPAEPA